MKIEMGESLFYSWLRHAKECLIVQSNWKPSPAWQLQNEEEINRLMVLSDEHFKGRYDYDVFKKNSPSQLLLQAEIDVVGVSWAGDESMIYAIDVAYHEGGLNYGDKKETAIRIVKKFIRSAMCLRGYFSATKAEIVFAAPKINPANLVLIEPLMRELNILFVNAGLSFTARLIANEDFNELVLKPIMLASNNVSDTSELFLRSYQLVKMFGVEGLPARNKQIKNTLTKTSGGAAGELKIGKIVQIFLRYALESGKLPATEIESMQTKEYSKRVFGIDFPLLVKDDVERNKVRYYSNPLTIDGQKYFLCSQWSEGASNNDRPFLMKWLGEHGRLMDSDLVIN